MVVDERQQRVAADARVTFSGRRAVQYVQYTYLGAATVVKVAHPAVRIPAPAADVTNGLDMTLGTV